MKVCCICRSFILDQLRSSVVVSNWQSFLAGDLVQADRRKPGLNCNWEAVTGIEGLYPHLLPISDWWCSPKCNICHVYIAQEHRSVHTRVEKTLVSVGRTVFLGA